MFVRVQPKLAIGPARDRHEQQADRIAHQVTGTDRSHELLDGQSAHLDGDVDRELASPGQPLPQSTRALMESRFGHDFGMVRVHADDRATESARSIGARAYTAGRHIVFGDGQYAPNSRVGQQLLAHELTHVVQQTQAGPGAPARTIQRQPDDKAPSSQKTPAKAPVVKTGMNRTLYVVKSDIWTALPQEVRDSAEKELNSLFAFVGSAPTEKAFSIKIVPAANLPEMFDFSESVVSVIKGDSKVYVQNAFDLQEQAIQDWLAAHRATAPRGTIERAAHDPSAIGSGGGSARVVSGNALHVAAGAVEIDNLIDGFLENVDTFVSRALDKAPGRGPDVSKWPAEVRSGSTVWRPLAMLGESLGRAIAHEARHEYIIKHADTGLGQDAPFPTGEKTTSTFSKTDQAAILARIKALEAQQGKATLVPVFPQSARGKKELFPF